jgi:glycosyltransferase involved in cell wall biosynthesis/predicted O-methyltransferase YrrM
MNKLLFVTPHLSTGGLPQYLVKKIESFKNEYEIWCIEYSNISDDFVVQKNKIKKLLTNKLITLGDNKFEIINHIKNISPDVIHFEEVPESFVNDNILNIIYDDSRNYNIVVTTHSSTTNPEQLRYLADKFILVSEWSREIFQNHFNDEIPCDIWEYPIDYVEYDKEIFRKKLGFDPEYKHVLNVGLFTPGKNQGELIELAREFDKNDYKVKFHFVGNQADNFQDYWKPFMNNLPQNCVIHGEKENVLDYYKASDVFYFTSNFELNPLSIKEALGFGLKVYAKKIHTYKNTYDGLVDYITGDFNVNYENLLNYLNPKKDITGWFSYSKIYDLFVEEAKEGSTIVEIGSWFGKSTNYLLNKIESSGKLINLEVIDTFKGTLNEDLHQEIVKDFDGDIYQTFYENIELNPNIVVHKNYSHDSSELFSNNSIDYLLIDGDHSYEGVTSDIKNYFYKMKPGGIISGDDYNVFDGTTAAVNEYFLGAHELYGNNYNWLYRIPKVQIIHVSTTPQQNRTKKSIKNFELLKRYGIDLKFIQNPPYKGDIDLSKYADKSNLHNVKPSHYGCFLGHTQALKEINEEDYDFTLILEEDAYIHSSVKEFVDVLWKAIFCCQVDKSIAYVSFGSDVWMDKKDFNYIFDESWHQILAHCYLIPNHQKSWYMEKISTGIWDSADLWYNLIFSTGEKKRLFSKINFSKQLNGVSIIDDVWKSYSGGYHSL